VKTPSGAHVLISHPAQHMAVAAFKDEELKRATPFKPADELISGVKIGGGHG
jgi:hypothetical protein